jgi:hypothetical protein
LMRADEARHWRQRKLVVSKEDEDKRQTVQ